MADTYDYAALLRPKCRVCSSSVREGIDLRLMGKETHEDGERLSYDEIVDWAAAHGVQVSKAGLSRHRTDHLMPDVLTAIEAQRQVEAIAQATGQTLGMETAFLNMLTNKAMRKLGEHELNDDGKWLGTVVRGIEVLLKVKRQEVAFSREKMEKAKGKMRAGGLTEETIREIEEQVLGLRR